MVITTSGFSTLARIAGKAAGVENVSIAEYPGPVGIHDLEKITENIRNVLIDRIVDGLTKASAAGGAAVVEPGPEDVVFTGTVDEVCQHFNEKGWSDGLPILPPTAARIAEFLKFTDLPPHEKVAILLPDQRVATPWNIAAAGVMAGCRPQHMPALVAMAEALGDERFSLNMIGSSSGLIPYAVFNGPAIEKFDIATGPHLVSLGANPALGRALGLMVRNIGGFRAGQNYMGTFGYPLAFAVAEFEKESPWEPFNETQGFKPGSSTVSLGVTNNWGPSPGAASTEDLSGADTALELMSREIKKKVRLYNYAGIGPNVEHVMVMILMTPSVAKSLAEAGYTKESVKQHLFEHTRMSLREFDWILRHQSIMGTTLRKMVEAGHYPPEFLGGPDDVVRILASPDILHIVVCGDPNRNRVMVLEGGHTRPTTKEFRIRTATAGRPPGP